MTTRRYLLVMLTLCFPVLPLCANELQDNNNDMPSFVWGARIGFAATGTYLTDAIIDNHRITEYTQDTQVGNFAAIQVKWNLKKILIQSGFGLSCNKSSFIADKNSWNPEAENKSELSCSYSMISAMIPFQVGYNIVNQAPYCMSVFTGPRLRYVPDKYYSSEISNTSPYEFKEKPNQFILGWTAGLSVQIGRTFLDFEYEASISNISASLSDISGTMPEPDYKLDRRQGIISFSFGIMF